MILACLVAMAPAGAEPARVGAIEVDGAWARAATPEAGGTTAYFTLRNTGTEPDRLVAVRSPLAERCDLRIRDSSGAAPQIRTVPDGLTLPPGAALTLRPQGGYVGVTGLQRALATGDRLPLVLTFERAGELTLEAAVRGRGAE